jgi:putative zinc finger/helix-turn-helix YgiT family protein
MTYALACPICGSRTLDTEMESDNFVFRSGGVSYPVHAVYPSHTCTSCGESFLSEAGETARHAATCVALNRLTPADILALRQRRGLSRKAFAEISGLGEASLSRWESGELIQSESNDNLLRLLATDSNLRALREIRGGDKEAPGNVADRGTAYRSAVRSIETSYSKVIAVDFQRFTALTQADAERATVESSQFRLTGVG